MCQKQTLPKHVVHVARLDPRKRSTTGGGQMTFRAARDNVTGHADVFFAIAHAVANEPLDTNRKRKSTWATSQEKKAA